MLSNDRMINIKFVITLVETYFNKNVTAFYVMPNDNEEDFYIECIVYQSFFVSFSLADIPKGGMFSTYVGIGKRTIGLSLLIDNMENLPFSFTEESINKNLDILNEYLIWRMTDNQKRSFNI